MKHITLSIAALCLAGCATQHFGRQPEVTDAERNALTCDQIQVEIDKNDQFIIYANEQAKTVPTQHGGLFGTYGMPDAVEHDAALKSAKIRGGQLRALLDSRGCTKTVVPATAALQK